jgi:small-conductance mechanosensitive channel
MDLATVPEWGGNWFVPTRNIVLIAVVAFIAIKFGSLIIRRTIATLSKRKLDPEAQKRAETLSRVIRNLLTTVIAVVALMMILEELGIDIGPILAAAGIVGLAVGFGAQSLVKDMINGFFILLEDQIRVGDVVQIAGKGGIVENVNLKMTVLRDLAGNVHYIPNGSIDLVTNMTKEYSRYVFEIGVAYREDVDEVMEVIREVDEDLRSDADFSHDILEPIEILGLDEFADSAIIIKARYKTKPIKQWRIAREFNRRLKKVFDERDIEIPFPHVTLYMGQGKTGEAPPMHIMSDKKTLET